MDSSDNNVQHNLIINENNTTTRNNTIDDSGSATTVAATTNDPSLKRSHKRSSEFKPQELLLIARSWIYVTDARSTRNNNNSSGPGNNFWNEVHSKYCTELQTLQDEDCEQKTYPFRTQSTIQQKWSKYILPNVQKFISIWNEMMSSLKIGREENVSKGDTGDKSDIIANAVENRDHETLYAIANQTFRVKYSKTTKDFSDYRLAWEFLRTKQKFLEYCDHIVSKAKVKAENDGSSTRMVVPRFATMNQKHDLAVNATTMNSILGDSSLKKRKLPRSTSSGKGRHSILGADAYAQVNYIKSYVKSSILSWQTSVAAQNCDSSLQKKYNDLLLQQRIKELEAEQDATNLHINNWDDDLSPPALDMENQMMDLKAFMQGAFVSWQTLMASQHCDSELQRKYHDLLLKQRIRELEKDNEKEDVAEYNPSLQKKYNDLLLQQRIRELEAEEDSHRINNTAATTAINTTTAGPVVEQTDKMNEKPSDMAEDEQDVVQIDAGDEEMMI